MIVRKPLEIVKKTTNKIKTNLLKIGKENFIILDFRQKTIRLPNGDIIKPEDIIEFDSQTKTILYISPSGELKTVQLLESISNELNKIFKTNEEKKRGDILYV